MSFKISQKYWDDDSYKNDHKSRIDGISSDYSQRRSYSSQKCSRLFVHPTSPSSILNPKITTIAKRPSETGNAGQRIEIYVNHFKIFCTPPNKMILY
ncbi:unnamed protein product [Rotaria magnacalcarata]